MDLASLVSELTSGSARARRAAADELGAMGPGAAKAVDALVAAALSDGSPPVRQAARAALLVVDGGAATAGLESALADRDAAMRMRATEILEALGVRARGAASRLVELALCDPEETVRTSAAYAAAAVDEDGTTVPGLVRAFTAGGSEESIRAVPALAAHGPRAAAAVPALSARLASERDPETLRSILLVLQRIGPGARDALPAVRAALHDPELRAHAELALLAIGSEL